MKKILNESHSDINKCRSCSKMRLTRVIDLGEQPLANAFIKKPQKEQRFPLYLVYCENCTLLQMGVTVDKKLLFENYVYQSSVSPVFKEHFKNLAAFIKKEYKAQRVVDIGSNDGILLEPLEVLGIEATGIEPSGNMVRMCRAKGLYVIRGWIDGHFRGQLKDMKADVVTACNVFAHVNHIGKFVENVRDMLTDKGVFIIEVAYLKKLIENNYFDTIYHEHFFYYSVTSLDNVLRTHGMKLVDVQEIPTHGGSIRATAVKIENNKPLSARLYWMKLKERTLGYTKNRKYKDFAENIKENKKRMKILLKETKRIGDKVVGYGAPAKANTMMNYFELTTKDIQEIYDDGTLKQGLYTPGTQIPVKAMPEKIVADFVIILAWNFAEAITQKLKSCGYKGSVIIPVPHPRIKQI